MQLSLCDHKTPVQVPTKDGVGLQKYTYQLINVVISTLVQYKLHLITPTLDPYLTLQY